MCNWVFWENWVCQEKWLKQWLSWIIPIYKTKLYPKSLYNWDYSKLYTKGKEFKIGCLYPYLTPSTSILNLRLSNLHVPGDNIAHKSHKYADSLSQSDPIFHSTRYLLLLARQRQHGMRLLPGTFTHNWQCVSNPRPFDLDSNTPYPFSHTLPYCYLRTCLHITGSPIVSYLSWFSSDPWEWPNNGALSQCTRTN